PQRRPAAEIERRRGMWALLWTGLGAAIGIMLLLVMHSLLWVSLAGPLWEFILEHTWDRRPANGDPNVSRPEAASSESSPGRRRVLVSDIHIDTWKEKSKKREAFQAFLCYVVQSQGVDEFILNGDLMDMPPA